MTLPGGRSGRHKVADAPQDDAWMHPLTARYRAASVEPLCAIMRPAAAWRQSAGVPGERRPCTAHPPSISVFDLSPPHRPSKALERVCKPTRHKGARALGNAQGAQPNEPTPQKATADRGIHFALPGADTARFVAR